MRRITLALIVSAMFTFAGCSDEPPVVSDWEQFLTACTACAPCVSDDEPFCVKEGESWCRPLCPDASGYAWTENSETQVCRCPDSKKFWSFDTQDLQLSVFESKKELEAAALAKQIERQRN